MLFNSYEFLFLFFPLVLVGYYFLFRKRFRLPFLACASYIFYGWWDYRFCSLLLISTVVDFIAGKNIANAEKRRARKGWLLLSLITNLSLLGFFKYWDLIATSLNECCSFIAILPNELMPVFNIILPVGISFYTFQSMSYSIDIYMGEAKPARTFGDFACYVALFPQLIAGPIVRYREIADQLVYRSHTWNKWAKGLSFFILGLSKKVIIADGVAPLVGLAFGVDCPSFLNSWVGVLAYSMQIYFDFSGYSDMAVGLGYLFGFEFPQNFDSPYKAVSITDFWRRWHMSLSRWLRDYLYIPLGGNRKGELRTYANLIFTMLLGGLWHGASWTFMLWGGYHGGLLAFERMNHKKNLLFKLPVASQRIITFILVILGWVLFRCSDLGQAGSIYKGLIGMNGCVDPNIPTGLPWEWCMLLGAIWLSGFTRNTWEISWPFEDEADEQHTCASIKTGLLAVSLCILFVLCSLVILVNSSSPFLYFQF